MSLPEDIEALVRHAYEVAIKHNMAMVNVDMTIIPPRSNVCLRLQHSVGGDIVDDEIHFVVPKNFGKLRAAVAKGVKRLVIAHQEVKRTYEAQLADAHRQITKSAAVAHDIAMLDPGVLDQIAQALEEVKE